MKNSKCGISIYGQIASAIYVNYLSEAKKRVIDRILKDSEITDKADAICECLNIEKRHNRSAIRQVLANNSL